jgi:hypothetical protein
MAINKGNDIPVDSNSLLYILHFCISIHYWYLESTNISFPIFMYFGLLIGFHLLIRHLLKVILSATITALGLWIILVWFVNPTSPLPPYLLMQHSFFIEPYFTVHAFCKAFIEQMLGRTVFSRWNYPKEWIYYPKGILWVVSYYPKGTKHYPKE